MPRIATVCLNEHIEEDILLEVARLLGASPVRLPAGFVDGPDIEVEDAELELFLNWDCLRGHGRGSYAQDDAECRSRRIDLRGPTDLDPGPLPMEEAPEDITGTHLVLI